jgi:SAM-dependent methyltransferase
MEQSGSIHNQKKLNPLYIHSELVHNLNAPRELVPFLISLTKPKSVLDVGCGTGTWLKAFDENGLNDYVGVDGDYVDRKMLRIPISKFMSQDLREEWSLNRKFDLVISLEVAEHLPEESAEHFVKTLAAHGEIIIFSTAIPEQGGQNHLNEQWPLYWQQKFERQGFYFHDVIRPVIWNNEKMEWWYRQNIFLLKKSKSSQEILALVHPECFKHQLTVLQNRNRSIVSGELGVWESLKIFVKSILLFRIF